MSNVINFDEKRDNGGQQFTRKTASPGVDVFTIEEAEIKNNVNGKEYVALKFVNGAGQYFKEQMYTNGFGGKRVQELAENAGLVLTGQVTTDDLAPQLIGTKVGLIVGGDKEDAIIDGKQLVVTRAKLKGAYNFSFKPADLDKYKEYPITIEDKTAALSPTGSNLPDTTEANDLPF